ncbi:hypothetical protein HRK28_18835 [Rathayibacter sp. VKM Ac-2835]|uniref:hypothetical protein n=1 Tax=Rathayibacter sp. VKM Ac-2835 TaxID=2739043 RepID=UPI001566FB76|nr:hypothetical protein [Rathayibacter sp. VKM Ac-2835]NRG42970.1 hypothetical protein [Rathayibacter sp. VKM Ac-2835]
MKHRRRAHLTAAQSALALSALALSGLLALSGCSAPADEGRTDETTSPLTDYLGSLYGGDLSPEEQEEKYREEDRAREELVATCMQEAGFEYTPSVQSASYSSDDDAYEPDDRGWVAQYGYGVVDSPGRYDSAEPEDDYVDANADYYDSLSESEQAAFSEALHGPPEPEDVAASDDESYEYDWTTAGCYGAASHELEEEDPTSGEEHEPVLDALTEFYSELPSVPELADLDAAWSSCLSDAGYPGFATRFDAVNSITEKASAVWASADDQGIEPTDPKLVAVKDEEIELALADLDCREKTDYTAVHKKVQDALEQQFIDDHRAELDALKAAAEQGE